MEEILGNIYCWFESLFGQNLADYLWGYNCNTQAFDSKIPFNIIGLITIAISFVSVSTYYYLINHPRFNRWWSWLSVLGFTCIVSWCLGFWWTYSDYQNGMIGDCLMYTRNSQGAIISDLISTSDCIGFGIANAAVTLILFIIISFLIRSKSRNSKYSPFKF